jgi:hypothetical protein
MTISPGGRSMMAQHAPSPVGCPRRTIAFPALEPRNGFAIGQHPEEIP